MRRGRLKGPAGPTGPWVIGFESGGDHLSVALWRLTEAPGPSSGWRLYGERTLYRGHQHADTVLAAAAELLKSASIAPRDVALVAAGRGPGGFTGVRVGLATAAGMAAAIGCPVWPVDSLEALATNGALVGLSPAEQTAAEEGPLLCPLIDAKRQEVYGALYRPTTRGLVCVMPARVGPAASLLDAARSVAGSTPVIAFGSGAVAYHCATEGVPAMWHIPRASNTALVAAAAWEELGRPSEGPAVDPSYVRPSDAELSAKPSTETGSA